MNHKPGEYIYVAYGTDGLPIAVAESTPELARIIGVTANSISKSIWRGSELYARVRNDDD